MAAIILTILQFIVNLVMSFLDFIATMIQNLANLIVQNFWHVIASYTRRITFSLFHASKLGMKTHEKLHKTRKKLRKHSKAIKKKAVFDQKKLVRARNI